MLGSPLRLDVHPGALHLPSCELFGDGVEACHLNERQTFRIRARDHFGNGQVRGGERFHVSIERPGLWRPGDDAPRGAGGPAAAAGGTQRPLTPSVRDDGDGTSVEYTLDAVGVWGLCVRHGGADGDCLPGAPLPLTCLPGSAHLAACRLVSAHSGTRTLGAGDRDLSEDTEEPTGGGAKGAAAPPHLGNVSACGSKLRVLVRLCDRNGTPTRMSNPKHVQLALLPERDPLDPLVGSLGPDGGAARGERVAGGRRA